MQLASSKTRQAGKHKKRWKRRLDEPTLRDKRTVWLGRRGYRTALYAPEEMSSAAKRSMKSGEEEVERDMSSEARLEWPEELEAAEVMVEKAGAMGLQARSEAGWSTFHITAALDEAFGSIST
jgi:hypothetical protein